MNLYALAAMTSALLVGLGCKQPAGLFALDDPNQFASALGHTGHFTILRDGGGTRLLLYSTTDLRVIIVEADDVRVMERPTLGSFLTSSGEFREFPKLDEYFTNDEFSDGKPEGQSGVDQSGTFFFAVAGVSGTWIGSVADRSKPKQLLPMFANGIFTKDRDVYVCGEQANRIGGTVCKVLKQAGREFEEVDQFYVSGSRAIVDVDPYSDLVLALGYGDLLPNWYSFDPATGKTRKLGLAHRHGFFLEREFLIALKARLSE